MSGPGLTLVVCGAPLARRAAQVARAFVADGWDVAVVGTPSARPWLDPAAISETTGAAPRFEFRAPGEPKTGGQPQAIAICPATFNTLNKIAAGIADNYAVAAVCEGLGAHVPVVAVPMVNQKLWGHPRFRRNVEDLIGAGVRFVDPVTGTPDPRPLASGSGEETADRFQPEWLVDAFGR